MRLLAGFIAAVPCFILAMTFLMSWIEPMAIDDGDWVRFGVGIMVLEFILVHSGAFMAGMKHEGNHIETLKLLAVAFGFYAVFAGAMALAFKSWTLFIIYTTVMVSRWVGIFTHTGESAKQEAGMRSGMSILFYLAAVFLSVLVPWPELGVTSSIVNEVYPDRGTGHWERNPETALAAGVLYFGLLGFTELVMAFRHQRAAAPS